MNSKELPWDRLATTDQKGNRIYLYPSHFQGRWKTLRTKVSVALIAVFLGLPWVRIGGHQAVLLDIPNRRFAIFGLTFWAHDAPLLFLVIGGALVSIAFVTAIWGRIWCGWACPQTVFVEQVFRRIETWIEGDALARRGLDESAVSLQVVGKKSLKWIVFSILALVLSHSFLAYFIGTEVLADLIRSSPLQNPSAFLMMAGISSAILFDFGWFREQFCTVICPYGRFQSVVMDDQSTVVAYDIRRGEPRRGTVPPNLPAGDCVNCYRCVQVCPTGIDIRRGVQLECIACTSCIDACDEVMVRLNKPKNLVGYGIQAMAEGKIEVLIPWFRRPRAWVYLALVSACGFGLVFNISHRAAIEVTLIRAVDAPYQEIPGSQVLNHFKVDLRNQTFEDQVISFSVGQEFRDQGVNLVSSNAKERLRPDEANRIDLFVRFPKSLLSGGRWITQVQVESRGIRAIKTALLTKEVHLVGPLR